MKILHSYFFWVATAILLLAAVLRLYQIGEVPHGITWDEAAIAYNGYAVFTTRRDEWLHFLPVSFRSFGDYKAPLAIYLSGISTALFGLNIVALRLPFVLFGILAVLGMILLAKEFFHKQPYQKPLSLLAGFLLAVSPWHIHFSRTGFESGIVLSFLIWILFFAYRVIRQEKMPKIEAIVVTCLAIASLYTYHSAKIVVPLVCLSFLVLFSTKILTRRNLGLNIFLLLFAGSLLTPLLLDSFLGDGLTRASVTLFAQSLSITELLKALASNIFAHLSPQFLLFGNATTSRHAAGFLGILYPTTLLLLIGLLHKSLTTRLTKNEFFAFAGALIGFLPALIATEAPHQNRALLALPFLILLACSGAAHIIQILYDSRPNKTILGSHDETNIIVKSVIGTLFFLHCIFAIGFIGHYFTTFKAISASDFSDGYIDAFNLVEKLQKEHSFEKIVFTNHYGQPYIYALFVKKMNPISYQGGALSHYQFQDVVGIGDLSRKNALVVGSGSDELPTERADYLVLGSDQAIRFQFFITDK